MSLKTLYSRRTCLIVQGVWHVDHCGCCPYLSIKECVSLLWLIRNRVIVTCSFRDFRKAGHHSPKKGLTWNSLLLEFLFCCHFLWIKLFILGFRSVYGMLHLSVVKSKADFAAASALWFPLTPMWLGIQQKNDFFVWYWVNFWVFNDPRWYLWQNSFVDII